jgi:coenzyme PQQ synthesis protein D (PqqD)
VRVRFWPASDKEVEVGRVARNPEVVCTVLEDGAVLLNMETRRYYSLNQSGLEVWQALGAGADESALAGALQARFDVDADRALEAVSSFVGELERERLVTPEAEDGQSSTEPGAVAAASAAGQGRRPFVRPELFAHEEPLHELSTSPFDPQLPLAE